MLKDLIRSAVSGGEMRRWMCLLVVINVLAGCSGAHKIPQGAPEAETRVEHQRVAGVAYEHEIELEVPPGHTRQVSESVQKACAAIAQGGCTLLESGIRSGEAAGATIRMRVTPDGVNKVLRALDGRGKVLEQSSKGQDLAEPIHDGERKMAMLTTYRDQLQTLARQRALDPEGLIKLHRELAEVQSQIDDAATSQAQLRRRVDTELLTVAMHERVKGGRASNVRRALEDFGDNLLQGVAMLITFVASMLPFALAGAAGYVAWRRIRKGRRRTSAAPDNR